MSVYHDECAKMYAQKFAEQLKILPAFYSEMMQSISPDDMSLSTKVAYSRDVVRFFEYLKESNPLYKDKEIKDFTLEDLENVTPNDANEYVATSLLPSVSSATVSRYIAACASMYIELMRFEKLTRNPFLLVRRPKKRDSQIIYLTESECDKLIMVIQSGQGLTNKEALYHYPVRDIAMISLILDTGIRVSEAVGLDIHQFDFEEHCAFVTRKGGHIDTVYFSDTVQDLLQEYEEERKLRSDAVDNAFFLNRRNGHRVSVRSMELLVKRYASIAIPTKAAKFSVHKLRSTFATSYYAATHDLITLQEKMGHQNIATTKIYTAALKETSKNTRNFRQKRVTS